MQQHGPNVLIFQVESEGRHWFIVDFYISPNYAVTIKRMIIAIVRRPRGATLMV